MQTVILRIEASEAEKQIERLCASLQAQFPDGVPEVVCNRLIDTNFGLSLAKCSSAVRADGTVEFVQGVDFAGDIEHLAATAQTPDVEIAHR